MKLLLIMIMLNILSASDEYKEPKYELLEKYDNIEVREYGEYIIAKTSINKNYDSSENNMFKTLASYIFGNNHDNQKLSMTAPVTTVTSENSFEMIFYMLEVQSVDELPNTDIKNITFEKLKLGKCAVISFSWFTTEKAIMKYKNLLNEYIEKNNLSTISPFMVNRYDPPWRLPFMRRNEILVRVR